MARLVDRQIGAARQSDRREQPPTPIDRWLGHRDPLGGQFRQRLVNVVAHQEEFVVGDLIRRMYCDLGGRQREDEPAVPSIDSGKAENIADEGSVGLGIAAVENNMGSVKQNLSSLSFWRDRVRDGRYVWSYASDYRALALASKAFPT